MAPEQLESRDADARTDLFAFGAVLYEMLTGRRAFGGTSPASVITAIMSSEPAPIATVQPLAPLALDRVVGRCLAKDPEARWQSAADLAQQLRWPQPVAPATGAAQYVWPHLLPGGKTLIFSFKQDGHSSVAALTLSTGVVRTLIQSLQDPR